VPEVVTGDMHSVNKANADPFHLAIQQLPRQAVGHDVGHR